MIVVPELPVAVIGAGPVGLAAAAHLVQRGIRPVVFERGESVGASLLEWAHVRVFSPWRYNIDAAARILLEGSGWQAPNADALPNGGEIVAQYLAPLAALPPIAANLKLGATVNAITREGRDKIWSTDGESAAFVVRYTDGSGAEHRVRARAVIDASGTWTQPNPIGVDGLAVPGEKAAAKFIAYGIPDVTGSEREHYAGKRVLVIGSGHSAINVALALMELQQESAQTEIFWALRRNSIDKLLGGGLNDELPERGALGLAARQAMDDGRLRMLAPFAAERVSQAGQGVQISALLGGQPFQLEVDRIVVTTGSRPDLPFLRELRIELDPTVEAPPRLAPLIDPNFHSCGTVPPHGIVELAHPEPGFTIVGSKSYGRAPTFLMATGYEQVRSVVADIAGDHAAARAVRLALPETGVCSAVSVVGGSASGGCCGGVRLQRPPMPAASPTQTPGPKARLGADWRRSGRRIERDGSCRMKERKAPASAIWALGVTQIIGYGTLYYSYSILAPAVADELAWSQQWVFAILSASLLASALLAPIAGHWADRFGAGRLMVPGSAVAAAALLFCALAPGRVGFALGVAAMELASSLVLYSTAFVAIVQLGGRTAQRSITHLTLIAGFASTLFWPLTTVLHEHLGWREVLLVFAVLNVGVCLPIHAWLARLPHIVEKKAVDGSPPAVASGSQPRKNINWSPVFLLMLAGFAVEGFVLSAVLVHMAPLTAAVGLGAAGVFVASLFGPSQVASRLINMLFGGGVPQTWLALGATAALALGLAVLLLTAPSMPGAIAFAVLFGLGSGLMSIVGGTLPLELFGRAGYGAHVGWITAARQFSSAFAPFGLTFMMAGVGVFPALWINVLVGLLGIAAFAGIALTQHRLRKAASINGAVPALGAEIV